MLVVREKDFWTPLCRFWSLLLCSAGLNLKSKPYPTSTFKTCYFESACTPFVGEFKMRGGKLSFKNHALAKFTEFHESRSLDFFTKSQSLYYWEAKKVSIEVPICLCVFVNVIWTSLPHILLRSIGLAI